jgi:hypothetical protein
VGAWAQWLPQWWQHATAIPATATTAMAHLYHATMACKNLHEPQAPRDWRDCDTT